MSTKKDAKENPIKALASLGQTIKAERLHQKLTLDELAKISGVSKGMLSQIELGKTNPTVVVLYKVAAGLHVPPARLLPEPATKPRVWQVIRMDDEGFTLANKKDCRIRTLSPLNVEKEIVFNEIRLGPRGQLISEPHFQGTVELLTIAKGQVRVKAGDNEIIVRDGDSIQFSADLPHSLKNMTNSPVRAYTVVWYRS
jgi:transcriptional regulator with XRE-family HTH domain